MNLPFVSRKAYDAEVATGERMERELSELVLKYSAEKRALEQENAELKARISAQDAAQTVATALQGIASATTQVAEAFRDVRHSVGAAALSLDKAANVQREWLEISKGNR